MMKRINDIFYSLQGEGYYTGRAAVFIRFSGCNLHCPFCDTDFREYREMSDEDILAAVTNLCPADKNLPMIVLTGGEPSLQVDEQLVDLLHCAGFYVAMETNGTHPVASNIDWITVSPKGTKLALSACDEIKLLFLSPEFTPDSLPIEAELYYLQPCDVGDVERNQAITSACIRYIQAHPQWQLSLQTHKLLGIK